MKPESLKYLAAASLLAGTSMVLTKIAVDAGANIYWFALASNLVAVLALTPFFLNQRALDAIRAYPKQLAVNGITSSGLGYLFIMFGLIHTAATNAGFLLALIPGFTLLFAQFMVKEKLPKHFHAVLLVMTLGGLLLAFKKGFGAINVGDASVFAAVLCLAFNNAYTKKLLDHTHADAISYARFFFSAWFVAAFVLVLAPNQLYTLQPAWLEVIGSSATTAFAILFLFRAIHLEGPSISSLANFTAGVVTAVVAMAFLGESMTVIQFAGAALIGFGVVALTRRQQSKSKV